MPRIRMHPFGLLLARRSSPIQIVPDDQAPTRPELVHTNPGHFAGLFAWLLTEKMPVTHKRQLPLASLTGCGYTVCIGLI